MPDQSIQQSASLITRASTFATQLHRRINQRRKYSNQGYEVHLKAVADIVASVTDDPEMIAAAWLHDTVEDTPATLEDIEREFGSKVARLVSDLTDVSRPSDGNRATRKTIDRSHSAQASARAKTIKLADLIDNCRDICKHDKRFARVFVVEMAALLEVLAEGDDRLLQRAYKTLQQCADKLSLSLTMVDAEQPDVDSLDFTELERAFGYHQHHTLSRILKVFTAQDVAEPLRSYDADMPRDKLAQSLRSTNLSVAGLREEGIVTGYILGEELAEGSDSAQHRRFRRDQVVDSDAALSDVVLVLTRHDYCFVRVLGEKSGVINRGDMQKPLVRMWLFGFITTTEILLRERLLRRWPNRAWADKISTARLSKAQDLFNERIRRGQACDLVDCLQISDLAQALLEDPQELIALGFDSKGSAKRVVKEFESLRNNLAHAQDIVTYDWGQIAQIALMAQRIEAMLAQS